MKPRRLSTWRFDKVLVCFGVCLGFGGLTPLLHADQVLLKKGTGEVLEYQSAARPGTLMQNAVANGLDAETVEERTVTAGEWTALRSQWIDLPMQTRRQEVEEARQVLRERVRQRLGLTGKEFEELREALR